MDGRGPVTRVARQYLQHCQTISSTSPLSLYSPLSTLQTTSQSTATSLYFWPSVPIFCSKYNKEPEVGVGETCLCCSYKTVSQSGVICPSQSSDLRPSSPLSGSSQAPLLLCKAPLSLGNLPSEDSREISAFYPFYQHM